MLTKALAVLGLAVLVASGPARADSCNVDVRGDDNVVNCTIVKNPTRHHYDDDDDYAPVVQPRYVPMVQPWPYVMARPPMMMGRPFFGGMGRFGGFGRR
jgi:hypothetical protein